MDIAYDPRQNVAYIRLRERSEAVETIRLSDEVNIDLGPDGRVYGIELLNANEQLGAGADGAVVRLIDEATGRAEALKLPA